MTDRELMQQVLDALEKIGMGGDPRWADDVAPILRARLAQPEPLPAKSKGGFIKPLYTAPPQREWQGLTEYEVGFLTVFDGLHDVEVPLLANFIRHIEAKLKEKNHG